MYRILKQPISQPYNGLDNAIRVLKQPISQPYNSIDNAISQRIKVLKQPISQPYNGIDNGLANAISRLITGNIDSGSVIFDNIHF